MKTKGPQKTIVKLIPQYNEYDEAVILVGFSDAFDNAEEFATKIDSFVDPIDFGVKAEPFSVSEMKDSKEIQSTATIIIDFIKTNMG